MCNFLYCMIITMFSEMRLAQLHTATFYNNAASSQSCTWCYAQMNWCVIHGAYSHAMIQVVTETTYLSIKIAPYVVCIIVLSAALCHMHDLLRNSFWNLCPTCPTCPTCPKVSAGFNTMTFWEIVSEIRVPLVPLVPKLSTKSHAQTSEKLVRNRRVQRYPTQI